jgi:hypothetical protein
MYNFHLGRQTFCQIRPFHVVICKHSQIVDTSLWTPFATASKDCVGAGAMSLGLYKALAKCFADSKFRTQVAIFASVFLEFSFWSFFSSNFLEENPAPKCRVWENSKVGPFNSKGFLTAVPSLWLHSKMTGSLNVFEMLHHISVRSHLGPH